MGIFLHMLMKIPAANDLIIDVHVIVKTLWSIIDVILSMKIIVYLHKIKYFYLFI